MQEKKSSQSRIKAVICGISSLVNISGTVSVSSARTISNDADAMRKDFALVGSDLRAAMRTVRGDVPKQLKLALK
jgi:hypothetical protein